MPFDATAAVRRKLNITWESPETDARVADVMASAGARLAPLLGLEWGHGFTEDDGPGWALFLDACLYEWSDAMDDFVGNYGPLIQCARELESIKEEDVEP